MVHAAPRCVLGGGFQTGRRSRTPVQKSQRVAWSAARAFAPSLVRIGEDFGVAWLDDPDGTTRVWLQRGRFDCEQPPGSASRCVR